MAPRLPLPEKLSDPQQALTEERNIMSAYSDTAKTYAQLSAGALVLSVTFFEKVVPASGGVPVDGWLIAAWLGWLVAALAAAFYQYLAVRFLERRGEAWGLMADTGHAQLFRWLSDNPWLVYGTMLAAFMAGSAAFATVGVLRLL